MRFTRVINAVIFLVLAALLLLVIFVPQQRKDVLYQVSVLNGLLKGDYDGKVPLREISRHGDFGIGTFDRLDGESIELDNQFYRVGADGSVRKMPREARTPFAIATFFRAEQVFPLRDLADCRALFSEIDRHLPTLNRPYAIKVTGRFSRVKVRSVPAQGKPYRVFSEAAKDQSVFELRDQEGTLVGFRMPEYLSGVNLPGYHLHFLSQDRSKGGHLLDCSLVSGEAGIEKIEYFEMSLPESRDFDNLDLSIEAREVSRAEGN